MLTRAPAASPSTTPSHLRIKLSNRQWKGLEIAVTHTKQTPDPFLIDNENAPFRATPRTWGRHSCLRNEAHTPLNCARTTSPRRVAQAGVGLCAFVSRAFATRPSSRGPFTGRRISLRVRFEPTLLPAAHPVATQLIISNRSARRLEMPESYTKQRTAPRSNRHKFTQSNSTCHPTSFSRYRENDPEEGQWHDERVLPSFPTHTKTTFCLARANPVA